MSSQLSRHIAFQLIIPNADGGQFRRFGDHRLEGDSVAFHPSFDMGTEGVDGAGYFVTESADGGGIVQGFDQSTDQVDVGKAHPGGGDLDPDLTWPRIGDGAPRGPRIRWCRG